MTSDSCLRSRKSAALLLPRRLEEVWCSQPSLNQVAVVLELSLLNAHSGDAGAGLQEVKQIGRLTKTVTSSGQVGKDKRCMTKHLQVTLSSKSAQKAKEGAGGRPLARQGAVPRSRSEGQSQVCSCPWCSCYLPCLRILLLQGSGSVLKGAGGGQKENRGGARDLVSLDEELLSTKVENYPNPLVGTGVVGDSVAESIQSAI